MILLLFLYLAQKDKAFEHLEYMVHSSSFGHIFFPRGSGRLKVSKNLDEMMHMGDLSSVKQICKIFPEEGWGKIKKILDATAHNSNMDHSDILTLKKPKLRHFVYDVRSIVHKKIDGVIICFYDITLLKQNESQAMKLLNKYRSISYELDFLFNHLDYPVWRRDEDNALLFYNDKYDEVVREYAPERSYLEKMLEEISNISSTEKKEVKICRALQDNAGNALFMEFTVLPTINGTIGYAVTTNSNNNEQYFNIEMGGMMNNIAAPVFVLDDNKMVVFYK